MLFQVATCNMLIIISSPLHRLRLLCRGSLFCTAAMQVFLPVSLVFALHMIKIGNRKNRNRTVNRSFFVKTDRKFTNGNHHSTSKNFIKYLNKKTPGEKKHNTYDDYEQHKKNANITY